MVVKTVEGYIKHKKLTELILVSSMNKEQYYFPTSKEYILSELISGTLSYLGRKTEKIDKIMRSRTESDLHFEFDLEEYFLAELKNSKKELSSIIKEDIPVLVKPELRNKCFEHDAYVDCELYRHINGKFKFDAPFSSLLYEDVAEARKDLGNCNQAMQEDIVGIGEAMRPFIEKDLKSMLVYQAVISLKKS